MAALLTGVCMQTDCLKTQVNLWPSKTDGSAIIGPLTLGHTEFEKC
jgi:hypothetical protein